MRSHWCHLTSGLCQAENSRCSVLACTGWATANDTHWWVWQTHCAEHSLTHWLGNFLQRTQSRALSWVLIYLAEVGMSLLWKHSDEAVTHLLCLLSFSIDCSQLFASSCLCAIGSVGPALSCTYDPVLIILREVSLIFVYDRVPHQLHWLRSK